MSVAENKRKNKLGTDGVKNSLMEPQLKKKKIEKSSHQEKKHMEEKYISYKDTTIYTQIKAKPEMLAPFPKIFTLHHIKEKDISVLSTFLKDIVTNKSLNTNLTRRFTNLSIKNENSSKFNGIVQNSKNYQVDVNKNSVITNSKIVSKKTKKKSKIKAGKLNHKTFSKSQNVDMEEEENDSDKILSYADFYEVLNSDALIFHLHHPCKFSFHGELKVTLIAGEIEVLGFILNESSKTKTINLYSPELYQPLFIESKSDNKQTCLNVLKENLKNMLSEENITHLSSNFKPNDSILLVEKLMSEFGTVIHNYMNLTLFPKNLEDLSSLSESLKKLQCTFKFQSLSVKEEFKKNPQWEKISINQCTVLCGGKGVGKSTLLRYYINQRVSIGEKILVFDFDPGQTEFTPPGFVSVTAVDEPLLGPNFTHIKDGLLMVYFGCVNTAQYPSKYLKCVQYIIEWCRNQEEFSNLKWFVNTMGFCKGLGVELMVSILKLLKPNTVVQIRSGDELNNYPFHLTAKMVNSKKGFGSLNCEDQLSYEFHVVNSCAELKTKKTRSLLTSAEQRNIMILSYLGRMLPPKVFNFNAVLPYVVPFSQLYLGVDLAIQPNDVLKAFNGSIVSLSRFEHSSEVVLSSESQNDFFKIIIKPEVGSSLGLGIVRGIDCEKRKFYIITHLGLEVVSRVNCLILGRISPPSCLYLKQAGVEGSAIYTSVGTSKANKRVKRSFRHKT